MSARLLYIASFSLLNLIQIPAEVTFSRLPASDEGKNGDMNKVIQSERLLKSRLKVRDKFQAQNEEDFNLDDTAVQDEQLIKDRLRVIDRWQARAQDLDNDSFEEISIQNEQLLRNRSLCIHNEAFCSSPSKYPVEAAKVALKSLQGQHNIVQMFSNGKKSETNLAPPTHQIKADQHIAEKVAYHRPMTREGLSHASSLSKVQVDWEVGSETKICPSEVKFFCPKRAMNTKREFKFILNSECEEEDDGSVLKQTVRVEVCNHPNTPGDFGKETEYMNEVMPTVCRQEYATVSLLALTDDKEKANLIVDFFQFPTACICFRKK